MLGDVGVQADAAAVRARRRHPRRGARASGGDWDILGNGYPQPDRPGHDHAAGHVRAAPRRRKPPATPTTAMSFPEVADLIQRGAAEVDRSAREPLLAAAQQAIWDTWPCLWAFVPKSVLARRNRVQRRVSLAPTNSYDLVDVAAGGLNHADYLAQAARPEPADRVPDGLDGLRPDPPGARRSGRRLRRPAGHHRGAAQVRAQFGLDQPRARSSTGSSCSELFTGEPRHLVLLPGTRAGRGSRPAALHASRWPSRRSCSPRWSRCRWACGWHAAPTPRRELGVNVVTIAGQSMPDFWTGIMLLTVLRRADPGAAGLRLRHLGRAGAAHRHHRDPADRPDLADGSAGDDRQLRARPT